MDISKVILWYRFGLISKEEFLKFIDNIDTLEVPYGNQVVQQQH
jgi:hypothetical protein